MNSPRQVRTATAADLREVLDWLKAESEETGEGFYCNKNVIENTFERGDGLCAMRDGRIMGFAVIQMFSEGGAVHIVETHPAARRQQLGSQLLQTAIDVLRKRGAHYVDAECTSPEGEGLCRRHGFEDYVDPRNPPRPFGNPKLRLYLSSWRPPVKRPWWE